MDTFKKMPVAHMLDDVGSKDLVTLCDTLL